jgi:hypothetical protein
MKLPTQNICNESVGRGEGGRIVRGGGVEGIEWSGIKGGGGGGKVLSGPVSSGLVLCVRRCYFAIIA